MNVSAAGGRSDAGRGRPRGVPSRSLRAVLAIGAIFSLVARPAAAGPGDEGAPKPGEPAETAPPEGAAAADLTDLSLEELMEIEVEPVYGASKHLQKASEAPASVSVVTADDIRQKGYRTLADALRSVPGVFTTYDRNYHYLGIRGFNRPGDFDTRVLLLADGHRVNNNVYDTATIGTEFPIDLALVDRIEVIRGPGSSLYGSNAFFGVINVVTKKGRDIGGFEASGSVGSFQNYEGRFTYGNRFENGLEILASATYFDSDGPDLFFEEFRDSTPSGGHTTGTDYDGAQRLFAQAGLGEFTLRGAYATREKGIPTGAYGTVFDDDENATIDAQGYLDLEYDHAFDERFALVARLYYDDYRYRGRYVYDVSEDETPLLLPNKDRAVGQLWGSELKLTVDAIPDNRITLGGEFQHNFRQDQENYDDLGTYFEDSRETLDWGVYLQDEFRLLESLILNAGLRYDHYETFGGSLNPRAALIFSPAEATTLKLLYGTAFRSPNSYESYYDDGETQKATGDLDPETIATYEIVVEQLIGTRYRATAAAYHYDIDDLISLETDPADGLLVFDNTDSVGADGLELEFAGQWKEGLRGSVSYAIQRAENEDTDETLTNSPEHLAKLGVVVPLIDDRLFAGIEVQFMSGRETLSGGRVDANVVTNGTLFGARLLENLDVSMSLYNVFDQEYGDPGSAEHVQDSITQDGTTFRL